MRCRYLIAASAAAVFLGGGAVAQTVDPPAEPVPAQEAAGPSVDKEVSAPAGAATPAQPATTPPPAMAPPAASAQGTDVAASAPMVTPSLLSNSPIPDTAENRARYGQPISNAGKRSAAKGN